jgi:hypothetical protein
MDIFKQMGITVGMPSLISEETQKSLSDKEVMEGQLVRKGYGSNPRDVLEAQLSKGGVSVEGLKDTSGESFHSDNDKEVQKIQEETEEIECEKSFSDSDLILKALGDLCEEPSCDGTYKPKPKRATRKGDLKIEVSHEDDDEMDKANCDKAFPVPPKKPSFQLKKEPKDAEQKKEEKEAADIDKAGSCVKKGEMPEGVSKKEFEKVASLHENSPKVAEQGKGQPLKKKQNPFIKSQGPGGVYFDFGHITGNPLADNATALLNQTSDPAQAHIANYQRNQMDKAMQSYVEKGEAAYMTEQGEGQQDLNATSQFSKPMDQQVKESFEKGEFGGNNTPAPITKHSTTEMTLPNGEVIKGMSETDAAVIEMMKGMMGSQDESGTVVVAGVEKVTVEI